MATNVSDLVPRDIRLAQARHFAFAIAKGASEAYHMVEQSAKRKLAELLPS